MLVKEAEGSDECFGYGSVSYPGMDPGCWKLDVFFVEKKYQL